MNRNLECVRFSSDEKNIERIKTFANPLNDNLVSYLKDNAWDDDISGACAVYLIIDNEHDGEVVAYFGIKCGMISSPFPSEIYDMIEEMDETFINSLPKDKAQTINRIKEFIRAGEHGSDIDKVAITRPGVELSQLCVNMTYRNKMKAKGIESAKVGAYIFHTEIYPLILKIKEYVGCQFLYLFAADSSKQKTLIRYYEEELGFTTLEEYDKRLLDDSDIVPIMPYYDYECKFMFIPMY